MKKEIKDKVLQHGTEKNSQRDKTKGIPSPDTKHESTSNRHG